MLTELCQELRNWFDVGRIYGTFTIAGGNITYDNGDPLGLLPGQYFRIVGSIFSDGVYKYPEAYLTSETFSGAVWALAIPKEVVALAEEIANWTAANTEAINSPYQSESFGGYSYSFKYGGQNMGSGANGATWQYQFASRLAPWRKI